MPRGRFFCHFCDRGTVLLALLVTKEPSLCHHISETAACNLFILHLIAASSNRNILGLPRVPRGRFFCHFCATGTVFLSLFATLDITFLLIPVNLSICLIAKPDAINFIIAASRLDLLNDLMIVPDSMCNFFFRMLIASASVIRWRFASRQLSLLLVFTKSRSLSWP